MHRRPDYQIDTLRRVPDNSPCHTEGGSAGASIDLNRELMKAAGERSRKWPWITAVVVAGGLLLWIGTARGGGDDDQQNQSNANNRAATTIVNNGSPTPGLEAPSSVSTLPPVVNGVTAGQASAAENAATTTIATVSAANPLMSQAIIDFPVILEEGQESANAYEIQQVLCPGFSNEVVVSFIDNEWQKIGSNGSMEPSALPGGATAYFAECQ